MNQIAIQIEEFDVPEWIGGRGPAAVIYVDGKSVTEFLKQFVPSICESLYSRSAYGRWIGIEPSDVMPPCRTFLGTPDSKFADFDGLVPLCACSDCGMYWCDGIWARITFQNGTVRWSDFMTNLKVNPAALKAVPMLEFDEQQYRDAFSKIHNNEQGTAGNSHSSSP